MYTCRCSIDTQKALNQHSTFLVFKSALLLLFVKCLSASVSLKNRVFGSCLTITQHCHQCGMKFVWQSQPLIGQVPLENLLISAAILYSGSLPSKALRMFDILKCSTINFVQKPSFGIRVDTCNLQLMKFGISIKNR